MTRALTVTGVALALTVLCLTPGGATAPARPDATPRIGVFDSRAVALAYYRSDEGMQASRDRYDAYAKAKASNDEARIKELEQEGPWMQVRMHQQVFSTATVATIMEKVADKLPAIAKEAGVGAIVSKWEMPYKDGAIQTVDVTPALVRLFNPDERTLTIIGQMTAPPIPFEKLPLDPKM